jgi:hypothetical protein
MYHPSISRTKLGLWAYGQIPLELFAHIAKYAHRRDLATLSRLNHACRIEADRVLYRHLEFRRSRKISVKRTVRCLELLSQPAGCYRAQQVRFLAVYFNIGLQVDADHRALHLMAALGQALPFLCNLEELDICIRNMPRIVQHECFQ